MRYTDEEWEVETDKKWKYESCFHYSIENNDDKGGDGYENKLADNGLHPR